MKLQIRWHAATSDFGLQMPWFGAWLIGAEGLEGEWFHSGRGAAVTEHETPADASGVRLRFWPSEGLDPEYIDIDLPSDLPGNPPSSAAAHLIDTASLDFDRPGPHSRLASRAG